MLVRKVIAWTGGSRNVSGLKFLRPLLRAKALREARSEGRGGEKGLRRTAEAAPREHVTFLEREQPTLDNVTHSLGESNVSENLRTSSSENDIYAHAFHCAFTIYLERNVACPKEIIDSMRSESKVTQEEL